MYCHSGDPPQAESPESDSGLVPSWNCAGMTVEII